MALRNDHNLNCEITDNYFALIISGNCDKNGTCRFVLLRFHAAHCGIITPITSLYKL